MVAPKNNDVIFDYAIIEAGGSDNPGVRIKGVRISDGPLYLQCYVYTLRVRARSKLIRSMPVGCMAFLFGFYLMTDCYI